MTPRTLIRPLAVLTTALLVALFAMPAASAATSDAVFVDDGPGWSNMYNTRGAGSLTFTIDGTTVEAYCVEMAKDVSRTAPYTAIAPDSTAIPNLEIAAWLAANHTTVPTAAADVSDEHAATQLAVWHYTDGIVIDATTVTDATVRARALALVAASASQSLPLVAADTVVSISGAADGNEIVWTATATSDGAATAGAALTVTSGATTTNVTTGADGSVTVRTPRAASGPTAATVTWEVATGAGALLAPSDGGQTVVTGTPSTATRTASANVEAQAPAPPVTAAPGPPVSEVTPTPPAAAPPAAAPSPTPSGTLPRTGGALGLDQALVAAALLALGGAALFRRRRNTI